MLKINYKIMKDFLGLILMSWFIVQIKFHCFKKIRIQKMLRWYLKMDLVLINLLMIKQYS